MFQLMPIGDDNDDRRGPPLVTYLLVAINVAVYFLLQRDEAFTNGYAAIPAEIVRGQDFVNGIATRHGVVPQAPGPVPIQLTLLSAMFMHGGFMHLAGNMLYLWIFGDNLEDEMGALKFICFYLLCGFVAAFAQIATSPLSVIPTLGASGAIAGVLGGYLMLFPARRVRVLVGWIGVVELPAVIVIGFWGFLQFANGFGALASSGEQGGVAYWAHIGGFVAGLLLVSRFRDPKRAPRGYNSR